MKLNNKGITLTEIIISIALISIVLIFLFSLLVTVNDINDESEVNSTYLINKSLILKNIESDLRTADSVTINNCPTGIKDIYSSYGDSNGDGIEDDYYYTYDDNVTVVNKLRANKCLQFDYGSGDKAHLGIYYYKNRNSYVISYIHGTIKATRELPDFEKNSSNISVNASLEFNNWKLNGTVSEFNSVVSLTGFSTITIPIIGNDGKDYSIIVSCYK